MNFREASKKFVELTTWIRELSSPQLTGIDNAESYREKLLVNFRRIGDIAQINSDLLKDHILPVIESKRPLTAEEISVLEELKDDLLDAYSADNLDIPFLYQVAHRLRDDAEKNHDTERIIHTLDDFVMADYALLAMVRRIYPYSDSAIRLREEGLDATERILEFLPSEKLESLPEGDLREAVLINARYVTVLYEYPIRPDDSRLTESILRIIRRSLSLLDSPEHHRLLPGFNWIYQEFRTLHYVCVLTLFNNLYGFNREQLEEINGYAKRLRHLWVKEQELLKDHNTSGTIQFAIARCTYLAGDLDLPTYKRKLCALADNARDGIYNADEMQLHTSIPIEYILTLDPDNISEEDSRILAGFYKGLIQYIHRMPKLGHLSFLLSELTFLLEHFIEVEDGISFETMCMELLAAIHPPTYVHSLSVADLSVCLAKHLFLKHPEMFERTPGYPDAEAVLDHVYHAAACHDVGKIYIVETIITYGRPLYDQEFEWIRTHTEAGANLLSKHEKTKSYAEVALGHQRWFDGKGGYPECYDPAKATDRLIVDIVACADCLDAATDSVGRSYKQGKTLNDFISELKEGCGSRYAPFLIELFEDEAVYLELKSILNEGRDDKYRHTFTILHNVLR